MAGFGLMLIRYSDFTFIVTDNMLPAAGGNSTTTNVPVVGGGNGTTTDVPMAGGNDTATGAAHLKLLLNGVLDGDSWENLSLMLSVFGMHHLSSYCPFRYHIAQVGSYSSCPSSLFPL